MAPVHVISLFSYRGGDAERTSAGDISIEASDDFSSLQRKIREVNGLNESVHIVDGLIGGRQGEKGLSMDRGSVLDRHSVPELKKFGRKWDV